MGSGGRSGGFATSWAPSSSGNEPTLDSAETASSHARLGSRGSEIVEFSPTAELKRMLAVVERNMAAAGS